ncbi:MAG TPA: toll/interleukin-1 receptor domain-containing protein [Nitrososphaera sp.]|jgi:uncharacterized protein YjbI with pentapeptide repeats|nr:toll/interleukin-1 receptor domain-containing protein [Nitrososphaera sp.]
MANPQHLKILKQGVEAWDAWRRKHTNIVPALVGAMLDAANLIRIDFSGADLRGASLIGANLRAASLENADLSYATLTEANLEQVLIKGAKLHKTILRNTIFRWNDFNDTDFTEAIFGSTLLSQCDLSVARGLEDAQHAESSTIGIDTIYRSKGNITEIFLRGCGLSDWQIEIAKLYRPDLNNGQINDILYEAFSLRAHQPIQISPLFISYSHVDRHFVDKLEGYLNEYGIRFWRDIHDATSGRLEKQIDRAIRLNPTVLLVLSANSVKSDWVEHEARLARKLEAETGRDVLCPVAIDDGWRSCKWPERLREQIMEYHILDFSGWNNEDTFRRVFKRLLKGLDLFYK